MYIYKYVYIHMYIYICICLLKLLGQSHSWGIPTCWIHYAHLISSFPCPSTVHRYKLYQIATFAYKKQFSRPNWLKQITKNMCGENITMLTYYDTCICIHIYIYNIHQYSIDNYIHPVATHLEFTALGTTQPTLEEDLVEPC